MIAVNLLSSDRRKLRASRRRVGRWRLLVATWCVALVTVAVIIVRGDRRTSADDMHASVAASEERRAALERDVKDLKARMAKNASRIAAANATTDHPDWSRLLVRIIGDLPKDLIFTRWELAQRGDSLVLRLEGEVSDVSALTGFVMRLEGIPAFRRVAILGARAPDAAHATAFEIEGILEEGTRP
ncbi:MAG: hypothetical protein JNM94_11410 [Phycisphaerae bacterium]|nr:hypothetical protein [Phycisphaerae bacterium]